MNEHSPDSAPLHPAFSGAAGAPPSEESPDAPVADSPSFGTSCLSTGDSSEKLTEILARVEAIERSLFEPDSSLQARIDSAGVANELLRAIRPILESQMADLKATWNAQLQAALSEAGSVRTSAASFPTPAPAEKPLPAPAASSSPRAKKSPQDERDWRTVIFSAELIDDPAIAPQLEELCSQILAREPAPSLLAGQLLIFQNASQERRPQLLKEVGEAYYRCYPKTVDVESPLETLLARWLERACDQAGYQNNIELVRPGQRFDSTRHLAERPGGVEITQVHGWVVLRSRDKVYTKASVTAR